MDRKKQGSDQRKQRVKRGRSPEEWELVCCKVQLLYPDWIAQLRDEPRLKRWQTMADYQKANYETIVKVMHMVGVDNVQTSTFVNGIRKAAFRLARAARKQQWENKYDFNRSDHSRTK